MQIDETASEKGAVKPGKYRWRYQGQPVAGILRDNCLEITGSQHRETREYLDEIGLAGLGRMACIQCGTCSAVCPHDRDVGGDRLDVRQMIQEVQFEPARALGERRWRCTSCAACSSRCPRGVDISVQMAGLRYFALESGTDSVPQSARNAMVSLSSLGNPFGEPREQRRVFGHGSDGRADSPEKELLFFPGCFPGYDSRAAKTALALTQILNRAGVNFKVLGSHESCCGESARRMGNEGLFEQLAKQNIAAMQAAGASRVLVISPHCYHTFVTEYPEFGADFEAIHYTAYLWDLIQQGRLKLSPQRPLKVTYHDPCYLGRRHQIYREPRQLLQSIPGLELVEMDENRAGSLCCGGGGGGIWMDHHGRTLLAATRLQQAAATGAAILATACPYCLTNFESINGSDADHDGIAVSDIAELVLAALEP